MPLRAYQNLVPSVVVKAAMLRSLPLERLYRDSRCGALMLPWTAELCTDMLGKNLLYEAGETDEV